MQERGHTRTMWKWTHFLVTEFVQRMKKSRGLHTCIIQLLNRLTIVGMIISLSTFENCKSVSHPVLFGPSHYPELFGGQIYSTDF